VVAGLSSFIGRVQDVIALGGLVDEHRLVTIVGPGGAGKTRLSIQMATERLGNEDTWIVELAPLSTPLLVAETIATALGATDGKALNGQAAMPRRQTLRLTAR
jgi:predicted ATPase